MGKQEFVNVLDKRDEIEKLLTPMGGNFMPGLKTISRKKEFLDWKEELKYQLEGIKQTPLIIETLQLLNHGFKNGLTDEKEFFELQGKLKTISSHINDFFDEQTERKYMVESPKLKKGTNIRTAFDEYTLVKQVGEGGNGRVFSAKNTSEENVAIKFVEKNIGKDKIKRFKNEISFCEHHKHKNIVAIQDRGYAYLDDKDYVFYVMPLYSETLKDKIKIGLPHEKILDIFVGLLAGLKFAHEHGSIHRDIKPENIMFAEGSYEPVICDFGIAHFAEEDLLTVVETKATDRMANFQYAAPEQRKKGGDVCFQTDIYALALILNEMFTGEIPQAAGYKRIKDINKDYAYLDDVFEQLFIQEPHQRLYPEDKILSEMKLLADKYKRDQEKLKLQNVINEVVTPEDFEAKIVNVEFTNGNLVFSFDKSLPNEWLQIIRSGDYTHSALMGYEPTDLRAEDYNKLLIPLRYSASDNSIKTIMKYVKEWVKTTNAKYSETIKRKAYEEQRSKENNRKAQIEKLEKENQINSTINSILADW